MIIAVQKGLENLSSRLRDMEFEVVEYGKHRGHIDAVVYFGQDFSINATITSSVPTADSAAQHGVFMVNASNKGAAEVAEILRRRTYSPLF